MCSVVDVFSDVVRARVGTQYGRYPVPDGLSGDGLEESTEYSYEVLGIEESYLVRFTGIECDKREYLSRHIITHAERHPSSHT